MNYSERTEKKSITSYLIFFTLLWVTLVASVQTAHSKEIKKVALLIGNADYSYSPLRNPLNDASDLDKKLKALGYSTQLLTNPSSITFQHAIQSFYYEVSKETETVSVFYYAGHAVQINNVNYMIPVDAKFSNMETLVKKSISINELLLNMAQTSNQKNLIILDACRVNPFKQSNNNQNSRTESPKMTTNAVIAVTTESFSQGLAPVEAPGGTMIAYATAPGSVAKDGKGRNGTYTKYLLKHLHKHVPVEEVFKLVREDVMKATSGKQIPWEHSSLYKEVYFHPPSNENIPEFGGF